MDQTNARRGSSADSPAPGEWILKRISLIISTITSAAALAVTLNSGSRSTVWLLGVATALSFVCIGLVYSRQHVGGHRTTRSFILTAVSTVSLLCLAWCLALRDHIRFSAAANLLSSKPAVLIADRIAWSPLPTHQNDDRATMPLIAFVDSFVTEPHHTRRAQEGEKSGEGVILSLIGEVKPRSMFNLVLEIPVTAAPSAMAEGSSVPSPRELDDFLEPFDEDRFLTRAYQDNVIRLPILAPSAIVGELLESAYTLGSAIRLARSGDDEAATAHFAEFERRSATLRIAGGEVEELDEAAPWLKDGMLVAARHYLDAGNPKKALSIVNLATELLPDRPELAAAEIYLRLRGEGQASHFLGNDLKPPQNDPALIDTLRGVVALREGDLWASALAFVAAARSDHDPHRRFYLHGAIAMLSSMVSGDARDRGERIVRHTGEALKLYPDVFLVHLLQGYGWALLGNNQKSKDAFQAARERAPGGESREVCDYWRAMGLAALGSRGEALDLLTQLEAQEKVGAPVLGLLAELYGFSLYEDTYEHLGSEDLRRAERLAQRAQRIDGSEVKSDRFLGFYFAAQAAAASPLQRKPLQETALAHLTQVIQQGGADAEVYDQMSLVYRELAQTVAAKESARKATELACKRDQNEASCYLIEVKSMVDAKDYEAAKARTNDIIRWLNAERNLSESARISLLVRAAMIWYEAEQLERAKQLYMSARRYLSESSNFPRRKALEALVDCNLGFILVDEEDSSDAERLFRTSLTYNPSADCQAGLALALLQQERLSEAVGTYRRAKASNENYANVDVLKTGYLWSDKAIALVRRLSSLDSSI